MGFICSHAPVEKRWEELNHKMGFEWDREVGRGATSPTLELDQLIAIRGPIGRVFVLQQGQGLVHLALGRE